MITQREIQRFWVKVKVGPIPEHRPDLGPCWVWTGYCGTTGYGRFSIKRDGRWKVTQAHQWIWAVIVGEVPEGKQLDHLCRVRRCVRPTHLEPVTQQVNLARGAINQYAGRTECGEGHALVGDNVYLWRGARICKICRAEKSRRYRRRKAMAA